MYTLSICLHFWHCFLYFFIHSCWNEFPFSFSFFSISNVNGVTVKLIYTTNICMLLFSFVMHTRKMHMNFSENEWKSQTQTQMTEAMKRYRPHAWSFQLQSIVHVTRLASEIHNMHAATTFYIKWMKMQFGRFFSLYTFVHRVTCIKNTQGKDHLIPYIPSVYVQRVHCIYDISISTPF